MIHLKPRALRPRLRFGRLALAGLLAASAEAHAETATVAVATNFQQAAQALIERYEADRPHHIRLVSGSTGKLYAQILKGAPYDVFLAADETRPALLVANGKASNPFTYAEGQLALWSADSTRIAGDDGPTALRTASYRHLAIANPELAPYGRAAMETLDQLGLTDTVTSRLVMGENVGQAFAMISSGAAELGFVALSYLTGGPAAGQTGSRWLVPSHLHEPIRQNAVLLERGATNPAARDFIRFLGSARSREVIQRWGYQAPW